MPPKNKPLPSARELRRRNAIEPVAIDSSEEVEPDEILVFTIDGEPYTMPDPVPAAVTLDLIDAIAERGEAGAIRAVMVAGIGERGWSALRGAKGLRSDQVDKVMAIVRDHVMGQVERLQGK